MPVGPRSDQLQMLQQICTFEKLGDEISLFLQRWEAFFALIWETYSEYGAHLPASSLWGEMEEVLTGSGCEIFVVPVDLSVSAKSLSKS